MKASATGEAANQAVAAVACWIEWKQRCALDLCSAAARTALRSFAGARCQNFARKCRETGRADGAAPPLLAAADAWHLLETHLVVKTDAAGKRYKDWLFARVAGRAGQAALDAIQGGATLIMRDVVREHLRREYSPREFTSLNAPLSDGDVPLTLEDILPGGADPADEAGQREIERLAGEHASGFFREMSRRERVALLARELGLSLAHPAVARAAGCGKSMLCAAFRESVTRVAARLLADYGREDLPGVRVLTVRVLDRLTKAVLDWAAISENACAHLFSLAGGSLGVRACARVES